MRHGFDSALWLPAWSVGDGGSAGAFGPAEALWFLLLGAAGACGALLWRRRVRREEERLAALRELARLSAPPLDAEALLGAAAEWLARLTDADGAAVLTFQGNGRLVATRRVPGGHAPERIEIEAAQAAPLRTAAGGGLSEPVSMAAVPALGRLLGCAADGFLYGLPLGSEENAPTLLLAWRRGRELAGDRRRFAEAVQAQLAAALAGERLRERLQRESRTDGLTGLASRRHFDELFRRELARARREQRPLSVAMIDLDCMKVINDEWGHPTGDRVLQAVARLLSQVRATDVVARYGGDEFVVLMPGASLAEAERVIERVRQRIDRFNAERHFPFPIRMSIGIREMGPSEDVLAEADAAMYLEKRQRAVGPEREGEESEESGAATAPSQNGA